uniref:Reverse transcriptase domain-containing protein n=1 Tax=Tanacetum cinerariifolium TaxID=118510 RepID=A0A699GUU2_TANCI|nr:reverse transcriptase domain-containing protein [Tanacetum cinerariifolium]
MPLRMTTRSAGRGGVTPRGGRTDARRGKGSGRGIADNGNIGNNGNNGANGNTGGNLDIFVMIAQQLQDLFPTIITQISNNANNQGNGNGEDGYDNSNGENNEGGYEHEKMESVIDMSNCAIIQMVKYDVGSLTGKSCSYTDWFHELAKPVPHLVTSEFKRIDRYIYGLVLEIYGMVRATELSTIQSAILKAGG